VAVVRCLGYGREVHEALRRGLDLLGGVCHLVRGRTVAVKLNLTGGADKMILGRPRGETYQTHEATVLALASLLLDAGARRVRLLESTPLPVPLEETLSLLGWDVAGLHALGCVEFEDTRNLGSGSRYARLSVPGGGRMFSHFEVNHSYHDADVMVSLCKLKNHGTAGVTLSMKNMFGITPTSIYASDAGNERATGVRRPLHGGPQLGEGIGRLPGILDEVSQAPTQRVPRIVCDLVAARPVDLAIIDGITAIAGGEGPWSVGVGRLTLTSPGVLVVGLNPVSTDAVGTLVMGYPDPRAPRGVPPFESCDNTLALAHDAGLGVADPAGIEMLGVSVASVVFPYRPLRPAP
jgi:uncharacterized protein (DUF362 family)